MIDASQIGKRAWSYAGVLQQAGLSCVEYVEQLTMLLFLKMADQLTEPPHSKPPIVPPALGWKPLLKLDGAESNTSKLQHVLWAHAVAASREAPTPITATFITALNDTIDLDESRLNAFRSRVPGSVWLLVLVVAGAGCYASGYGAGAIGARTRFANILLPLLIAIVITIIADFDRPRHGLISVSQQPMLDLKAGLSAPTTTPQQNTP